jgi:hypothetical protein
MNSVAVSVIEYRVITECGRIFSWSATSPDSLFYEFKRDKGLSIAMAEPYADWEARQVDGYEQLELNAEHEGMDAA